MKEPRMHRALRMAAIVIAASGVLATLGNSSPQAPAVAPASPSLVMTPPAGTVVRRGEELTFRLTVQGGTNVPHDFVLTRGTRSGGRPRGARHRDGDDPVPRAGGCIARADRFPCHRDLHGASATARGLDASHRRLRSGG